MSLIDVRRTLTQVETIYHEFGPRPARPQVRGAILSVLTNPYAGRYEPNIVPMMEALNPVGIEMSRRLLAALRVGVEQIEGYGKGAIVGSDGELEHGSFYYRSSSWLSSRSGWARIPSRASKLAKMGSPISSSF